MTFTKNEENKWWISKRWNIMEIPSDTLSSGRREQHNVWREVPGPSSHSIRNVNERNFASAWRFFINEKILCLTKLCTEAEDHRSLQYLHWNVSLNNLDAFISVLYAHGDFISKGISIKNLRSTTWAVSFFHQTMARDRFKKVIKYLRFDLKQKIRFEKLRTDQFALASEIWNIFIENCLLCYKWGQNIIIDEKLFPRKARCLFTQYMPQKPDKVWLAGDVQSKNLLNGFPYCGK